MPGSVKMLKINTFLFIIFFSFQQVVVAQNIPNVKKSPRQKSFGIDTSKTEYYSTSRFLYEDHTYKNNIQTVQLSQAAFELTSQPLLTLNSDEQLKLSFDDFDVEMKTYNYTVIHCNAGWEPSVDLSPDDYLASFEQDFITDYKYSFNSLKRYIHYNVVFPNDNIKITKSGNYILKVFQDNDPDKYILSRRFMVVEEKVRIDAQVRAATNVNDRNYKQEVDFTIDHTGYEIADPFGDIKVVITQNGRWDNAIMVLKPLFMKENQLVYDYDEDNVFPGGSEFRYFEIRNLRYQSERIDKIEYDSSGYQVYLLGDERRNYKKYSTIADINGKFLIKGLEGMDPERECDYAYVHFFLPYDPPTIEGVLYVFGALTDWKYTEANKMKYNSRLKGYECTLYLKQGYYNYEYVFLQNGEKIADETFIEGMHYETENEYSIYLYHHAIGTRYDQLIGVKRVNSH